MGFNGRKYIMKALSDFLKSKVIQNKGSLDEKTVFYIFKKIIQREYGQRGEKNIQMQCYKNKIVYIQTQGSVWANEIWLNKKDLVRYINQEIGEKEVQDIKVQN
jgi:hypothetical protein